MRILTRRPPRTVPLQQSVEVFEADLTDPSVDLIPFVDGMDVVYHCAGVMGDNSQMHAVHVEGTRRLLEAASGTARRWVQLSSAGAYGPRRAGVVTEESALEPVGPYETTKVASDTIAKQFSKQIEVVILRPTIVFGADMSNQSIFQMIDAIDRRLFFFVGPPGSSANYIHVGNVVEAMYRCGTMTAAVGRTYNLSDSRYLEEFVAAVAGELGRDVPRLRLPYRLVRLVSRYAERVRGLPLTVARVDALSSRARYPIGTIERELGYTHAVSMEAGVKELVSVWRTRRENLCAG